MMIQRNWAQDSQIALAKENLKFSLSGPNQRHASGINQPIEALRKGRHWVWGMKTAFYILTWRNIHHFHFGIQRIQLAPLRLK